LNSRQAAKTGLLARIAPWVLLAVGGGVYANSLSGSFIFDDLPSIVENDRIRQVLPLLSAKTAGTLQAPVDRRPIVRLSLVLNYAIGGLDVRGYHLVNIGVHLLCALVLFGVVRRSRGFGQDADGLALSCALLWMVHPLQTQCVNYTIQRSESIMGLFYLLTLYCASRGMETNSGRWYGASALSCGLGMASKETMVTAPVVVLLYDRVFHASSGAGIWRQRRGLHLGLAGTWMILAALMGSGPHGVTVGFSRDVGPWDYAKNQCVVLVDYLRKVFWPQPLRLDYGYPLALSFGEVAPYAGIVLALLVLTGIGLFLRPRLGFLGAWFFVILGPTSSFVPIVNEVGAERRMYLPLAGLIALVVVAGHAGLGKAVPRQKIWIGSVLVAGAAAALSYGTIRRNQDFRSPVAVWQTAVDALPLNPRGHSNLGNALESQGRLEEAIAHYRRAVELRPDFVQAYYNLGNALQSLGRYEEAIESYRRALLIRSDYARVYNNLGTALRSLGRYEEAILHFREALALRPELVEAHHNLKRALELKTAKSAGTERTQER